MSATDWYDICEEALVALLRDKLPGDIILPATREKQVTRSDADVLGMGHDYFVITYPGAFPTSAFAPAIATVEWEIGMDIYARCVGADADNWKTFRRFRSEIFQLFLSYRTLNRTRTIMSVALRADEDPTYYGSRGNPDSEPVFLSQSLTATVTQMINRTGGEFRE